MRISDWSSDVCSSDLGDLARYPAGDVSPSHMGRIENMSVRGRHDVLCFSREGPCSWGLFAADVAAFRADIAEASHVCNLLPDRYEFMVGLAAAMLNDQITVLPSATATEAIAAAIATTTRPVVLDRKSTSLNSSH